MRPRIIAVDFDGTLCTNAYPDIGDPIPSVIEYIKHARKCGNIVILWTCRTDDKLTEAVAWAAAHGLEFDYINENVKHNVEQYGGDTRKIFADIYLDDKALLPQQIIIKESIEMTNKERQEITTSIAEAVINDIGGFADKLTDAARTEFCALLQTVGEKHGVKRKNLDSLTWAEIAEISASGKAAAHFRVGDTKHITLCTGEQIEVVILGFEHDVNDQDDETCAGITFGVKNVLDGWFEINADYTNVGGWRKSKMRTVYMPRFEKLLPADLREVLIPVVKFSGVGGGSDEIETTVDKLFLLSEAEVVGEDNIEYSAEGEGSQYEYFANDENRRVKYRGGSACHWWLRSPHTADTVNFRCVSIAGNLYSGSAYFTLGVSFGFCV